jgi:prepilin-type N-terminal cleavage/methylation domain-containing protein
MVAMISTEADILPMTRLKAGRSHRAFTLIELFVAIAVIGILTALLLAVMSKAKASTKRTACLSNLKQINIGMRLYWDDNSDFPPGIKNTPLAPFGYWTGYKKLMKSYVGLTGASSPSDKLFACAADTFYYDFLLETNHPFYMAKSFHNQPVSDYSSYFSNAGALTAAAKAPGLRGHKIDSVRDPTKTILVAEMPAFFPYSWHEPKRVPNELAGWLTFNDAKNIVSFVDGHVSYRKMYWDSVRASTGGFTYSMNYDPPAGYDYKWSGE